MLQQITHLVGMLQTDALGHYQVEVNVALLSGTTGSQLVKADNRLALLSQARLNHRPLRRGKPGIYQSKEWLTYCVVGYLHYVKSHSNSDYRIENAEPGEAHHY